jgi:hypothetical protein
VKTTARHLLSLEVLICFGPISSLLMLGLIAAPIEFCLLLTVEDTAGRLGALLLIGLVLAGVAGLAGLLNLMLWLSSPPSSFLGPGRTLAFVTVGALAVIAYGVVADSTTGRLVGLAPLMCTVHLLYLARTFVFSRRHASVGHVG